MSVTEKEVFMKVHSIIEATKRPAVYSKGTAQMWVDKYISDRLLEVHLNPEIELASRNEATIEKTVRWILDKVPGDRLEILDLGCGPGLYAEKMAVKGHTVTGMDFSANSISYARGSADCKGLGITYLHQDYLELDDENRYDLIMMIFTDFGVLIPEERERLLKNIHRALKPGGRFLFDVLNENFPVKEAGAKNWESVEKGFWRDKPYLALTESIYYEEQQVTLSQHVIIDGSEEVDIYRFWIHTFSHGGLEGILSSHNFRDTECYDRLIPDCDMYRSEDVTFCISKK
jgi:SAM-dependent methyltransferase